MLQEISILTFKMMIKLVYRNGTIPIINKPARVTLKKIVEALHYRITISF